MKTDVQKTCSSHVWHPIVACYSYHVAGKGLVMTRLMHLKLFY